MDKLAPLFDPTSDRTAFEQAWVYFSEAAIELEQTLGVPIAMWKDLTMAQFGIQISYGIETVMPNPRTLFYRVTDDAANILVGQASKSPDAFDAAKMIAFANVWNGAPMPASLRAFAARLLNGDESRPKQQGGGITNLFLRWQIYSACQMAHDLFGLDITRQDYDEPNSAADLMSQLADEFGHPYSFNTIRDWFKHKNYTKFRRRCALASGFMTEKYLIDLGVIKQPR
ncbi:hypothetical protein [Lentibacter sp. XHP0401]|uniref:hypothetical protein n=1 Tax=Lentibacter sp. XHP0401 TaxID=2984334 RepID=UPI0021E87793|nr:hypothetical protein [Lentibacter sp. XHP0401]MCV2892570.1 hypothetical protein [Lentibacter sp. XHP0401]